MTRKVFAMAAALALALSLSACAVNNDNAGNDNGVQMKARNNLNSVHNNTRLEMDERIADAVSDMEEVDTATVLLTDNNAYVAVMLNNGNDMARERNPGNRDGLAANVKDQISAKVKQMAPRVRNVYVSANPDFVNRMKGYGERFQGGEPIRGLMIEFNRMVKRVFPGNANDNRLDGNMDFTR